jgi:DNA-binding YbaB/EbfC family protein
MGGFNPKQLQEMIAQAQRQAQDLQEKMSKTVVEASAGGGTVTVKMTGQKRLVEVKIEPDAISSGDVEMLQDLVMAAVNEASRKADEAMQSSVGGMLSGMGIPGMGM